jgi:hypothetical protein
MNKLVCIRTVFFDSPYDKKSTKWNRNKIYHFKPVDSKSMESLQLIGYMETDMIIDKPHHGLKAGETYYSPVTEKEYKKYFTTIEDFRDRKIAHILNNKENDNKDDFIRY